MDPIHTLDCKVKGPQATPGKKHLTVYRTDVCFAVVLIQLDSTKLNTTVRPLICAPSVTFDFNQSERSSR